MAVNAHVQAPPRLEDDITTEGWKKWRQQWDAYVVVSKLAEEEEKYQVAMLITCLGSSGLDIYNGLPFTSEDDKGKIKVTIDLFEQHFAGQTNIIYERYNFHTREQKEDESNSTYITALRRLAKSCSFGNITPDDLLRDRIVCGIKNKHLRQRLLQEKALTLEKCVDMCKAAETAKSQATAMTGECKLEETTDIKEEVHFAKTPMRSSKLQPNVEKLHSCVYCGREHPKGPRNCPAYGVICRLCKKANHFARQCRQRQC